MSSAELRPVLQMRKLRLKVAIKLATGRPRTRTFGSGMTATVSKDISSLLPQSSLGSTGPISVSQVKDGSAQQLRGLVSDSGQVASANFQLPVHFNCPAAGPFYEKLPLTQGLAVQTHNLRTWGEEVVQGVPEVGRAMVQRNMMLP